MSQLSSYRDVRVWISWKMSLFRTFWNFQSIKILMQGWKWIVSNRMFPDKRKVFDRHFDGRTQVCLYQETWARMSTWIIFFIGSFWVYRTFRSRMDGSSLIIFEGKCLPSAESLRMEHWRRKSGRFSRDVEKFANRLSQNQWHFFTLPLYEKTKARAETIVFPLESILYK